MDNVASVILLSGLLIAFFIGIFFYNRDRKRQKKIISIRKRIASQIDMALSSYSPDNVALAMPREILKQKNQGRNPNKSNYPAIKVHSYGGNLDLASEKKGIWPL